MKHVVLWRSTQPSKQYRHLRVNFRTPRCLSLTVNSNLFLGKRSVHRNIYCKAELKHYSVDIRAFKPRDEAITALHQMVYLCVLLLTQLERCAQDLGSTSKAVGSSMAQLLTCAAQGNEHYTGKRSVFYTESKS